MKTNAIIVALSLTLVVHADTFLTIGTIPPGPGGPCYDDTLVVPNPPVATGNFTLSGVTGTGVVHSAFSTVVDNIHGQQHPRYSYSVDMSALPVATNHCVRLLIHFGTPHGCSYDVLQFSGSGVPIATASKAVHGDITFTFSSGCLQPSQTSSGFAMLSDAPPKTGIVTVIDDYSDPASGLPQESRINVNAIVPDVPPNWAYAPTPIPFPFFQGILYTNYFTNSVPMKTNVDGTFDFTFQIFDALSNGLPVGPVVTQTVQVVHGLFNLPLPYEPGSIDWGNRWLDIAVRPAGQGGGFSEIGRQPVTPTPQALYAYAAGSVADISPDQAVTGLNGFTGGVTIAAGAGIQIFADGSAKTITISQGGQPSDQNIKTDFATVQPEEILARLMAMPIRHWRFTNEITTIRHLGPTAQDFKSAFDLGNSDRTIGTVDEGGVALAAIQGLNQKLEERLKSKDAEIEELKTRLEKLEKSSEQAKPGD